MRLKSFFSIRMLKFLVLGLLLFGSSCQSTRSVETGLGLTFQKKDNARQVAFIPISDNDDYFEFASDAEDALMSINDQRVLLGLERSDSQSTLILNESLTTELDLNLEEVSGGVLYPAVNMEQGILTSGQSVTEELITDIQLRDLSPLDFVDIDDDGSTNYILLVGSPTDSEIPKSLIFIGSNLSDPGGDDPVGNCDQCQYWQACYYRCLWSS